MTYRGNPNARYSQTKFVTQNVMHLNIRNSHTEFVVFLSCFCVYGAFLWLFCVRVETAKIPTHFVLLIRPQGISELQPNSS